MSGDDPWEHEQWECEDAEKAQCAEQQGANGDEDGGCVTIGSPVSSSARVRQLELDKFRQITADLGDDAIADTTESVRSFRRFQSSFTALRYALLSEIDQLDLRLHLLEAEQDKQHGQEPVQEVTRLRLSSKRFREIAEAMLDEEVNEDRRNFLRDALNLEITARCRGIVRQPMEHD